MAFKKTQKNQEFFTVRGHYSNRVSARGYGTLQPLVMEFDLTLTGAIAKEIKILKTLVAAPLTEDSIRQINQLRGKLGNWRNMMHNQKLWPTAQIFMALARELLPTGAFQFLMAETRAVRERHAEFLVSEIERCLASTKVSQQPSNLRQA